MTPPSAKPPCSLLERLRKEDPDLIRLDLTAALFSQLSTSNETAEFLATFPRCSTIESVHLSGADLDPFLTPEQIQQLVLSVGAMPIEDLCVFRGGSPVLDEKLLAQCLSQNRSLKALLLFQFDNLQRHPNLAGALHNHPTLERVTLTLTITRKNQYPWGCLDVFAMGCCQMQNLRVLQIRCNGATQQEPLISPDAGAALFASPVIEKLYLENVGLLDDHLDVMEEELEKSSIQYLQLSGNLLSVDALYSTARMLPYLTKLKSIDLSGCEITDDAGEALASAMAHNTVIINLELEGGPERYQNEFDIPVGHSETAWMKQIYYYLRLNRAQPDGPRSVHKSKAKFVAALNSVSDQLDCLYHLVRSCAVHFEHTPKSLLEILNKPQRS